MSNDRLKLARNLSSKKVSKTGNRLVLIIATNLITFIAGYFVFREIQLRDTQQSVADCIKNKDCSDNIEALEKLVKAKKSLRLYNLKSADLENAHLANANLERANLEKANLSNVHLGNADLKNANLADTKDFQVHFEDANLEHANFSKANLERGFLIHANLKGAHLNNTHFFHAYLNRANLQGVHLHHADFEQANFHRADLSDTYIYSSNFRNANLYGANLKGAHLIEPQNLTSAQIKSACNWDKAYYKGHWILNHFRWRVEHKANEQYINQLKKDHASDPTKTVDCSSWS